MNKLRVLRAERRLTQVQLWLSTGIHASRISLLENGLVKPRDEERKRIARALGVLPKEIWGG